MTSPRPRVPLEDKAAETLRKESYWAEVDAKIWAPAERQPVAASTLTHDLIEINTVEEADFEAFHMRHSIGHSWDHYSKMGEIYSIRNAAGFPLATLLVAAGMVVHARQAHNARLSPDLASVLENFAERFDWTVVPDRLPFDYFPLKAPAAMAGTTVTLIEREGEAGIKTFTATFGGEISEATFGRLCDFLKDDPVFDPDILAASFEGEKPTGAVELRSIQVTDLDEPLPARSFTADQFALALNGCLALRDEAKETAPSSMAPGC